MRAAIEPLSGYFAVPRVSKWAIFIPMQKDWLPGDLNVVLASDDVYVLGLVTSSVHRIWLHAQKSTLEDRTRYTHDTIFETFPFPQLVSADQVAKIRQAMGDLHTYRNTLMLERNLGITDLYNAYFDEPASQLAKLHAVLDGLVLKAYGWSTNNDLLSNLLDLNLELAEREAAGEAVVGPRAPV